MKLRTNLVLAGVCTPLIAGAAAQATFTGLVTEAKPNQFGLFVCNVYAQFNEPGIDHIAGVIGNSDSPMNISVIGGTFYQNPFGSDRPPNPAIFPIFPSLRYDTFVTIGVKSFNPNTPGFPEGAPDDNMSLSPNWPGFTPSALQGTNLAWAVNQADGQGDPFNLAWNQDGRVLIGQFATADGIGIQGMLAVVWDLGGHLEFTTVSFQHFVPGPGAGMLLAAPALLGRSRRRRAPGPRAAARKETT